jgi:hypothetical protein
MSPTDKWNRLEQEPGAHRARQDGQRLTHPRRAQHPRILIGNHWQGEACRANGGERAVRHGEQRIPDPQTPIGEGEEELLQPAIDQSQNRRHVLVWPPTKIMR